MKKSLIILNGCAIILFSITNVFAQEKFNVSLKNDTVYNNNVVQFICQTKSKDSVSIYSLRSLDNKLQALLIFRYERDTIKFSGTFPYHSARYACLYPKIDILTLLDSYIRNKVMVNGVANLAGLEAYCKERHIVLDRSIEHSSKNPSKRDSVLTARAKADAANQIKFTIYNKAPKPVKVFIGDKPKGGSGRLQLIPAFGELEEHARNTERVFLISDNGGDFKAIAVNESLTKIVINASADGFE